MAVNRNAQLGGIVAGKVVHKAWQSQKQAKPGGIARPILPGICGADPQLGQEPEWKTPELSHPPLEDLQDGIPT